MPRRSFPRPRRRGRATAAIIGMLVLVVAAVAAWRSAEGDSAPSSRGVLRTPSTAIVRGPRVDRYVSPLGADGNHGSRTRPWRTLAHAATRVSPGDTVHVAPGRYAGPLTLARGGTAARPVRFVSARRWGARISASGGGPHAVVLIRGDHIILEGFDVTGSGADGTVGIAVEGDHGAVVDNHVHDLGVPCLRSGNGGAGIVVGAGGANYRNHDGLVAGNLVERIGSAPRNGTCRLVHGIYASVRRVTIVNNVVVQASGDGITSWHGARHLVVANNLSIRNGGAGILVGSGGGGATSKGNTGTLVSNNIVFENAHYGITEAGDGIHRAGPGNRYLHNLTFGNGTGGAANGIRGLSDGETVSGNIDANPRLSIGRGTDARRGFDLQDGSPAIDAGTCVGAPDRDIAGVVRPQGSAVDIGPQERRVPAGGASAGGCPAAG